MRSFFLSLASLVAVVAFDQRAAAQGTTPLAGRNAAAAVFGANAPLLTNGVRAVLGGGL